MNAKSDMGTLDYYNNIFINNIDTKRYLYYLNGANENFDNHGGGTTGAINKLFGKNAFPANARYKNLTTDDLYHKNDNFRHGQNLPSIKKSNENAQLSETISVKKGDVYFVNMDNKINIRELINSGITVKGVYHVCGIKNVGYTIKNNYNNSTTGFQDWMKHCTTYYYIILKNLCNIIENNKKKSDNTEVCFVINEVPGDIYNGNGYSTYGIYYAGYLLKDNANLQDIKLIWNVNTQYKLSDEFNKYCNDAKENKDPSKFIHLYKRGGGVSVNGGNDKDSSRTNLDSSKTNLDSSTTLLNNKIQIYNTTITHSYLSVIIAFLAIVILLIKDFLHLSKKENTLDSNTLDYTSIDSNTLDLSPANIIYPIYKT